MVQAEAVQEFFSRPPRIVQLTTSIIGQHIDHQDGSFIAIVHIPAGERIIISDFHPATLQTIWTWDDSQNPGNMIIFPDEHVPNDQGEDS